MAGGSARRPLSRTGLPVRVVRSLKEQHQRSRYVRTTTAQFSGATPRSRLNWTRTLPRVAVFEQEGFDVRVGWGPRDAAVLAPAVDALVVVDVLRFTTAVDVAVARGVDVYPYPWRDGAADYAAERGVELADGNPWSLSPVALSRAP